MRSSKSAAALLVAVVVALSGLASASATSGPVWVRTFRDRVGGHGSPQTIAVSPDGTLAYVAGQTYGTGDTTFRALLLAYSTATGDQAWQAKKTGEVGAVFFDVAVDPTGARVFGVGGSYASNTPKHGLVRAYDARTGAVEWTAITPVGGAELSGVVSSDGSRLFVEAVRSRVDGTFASEIIAYDASTGAQLWSSGYDDPHEPGFANPGPIRLSSDEARLYVAGTGGFPTAQTFDSFAVDASDGHLLWARTYAPHHAIGGAIDDAISPDGSTFVATGGTSEGGFTTVAYDAVTGAQRWVAVYPEQYTGAEVLAMSPDGTRVYVAGEAPTGSGGFSNMMTVAYDVATGAQVWVNTYASPNLTTATNAMAVSPDGTDVVVAGSTGDGSTGVLAVHVVNAATGADVWTQTYTKPKDTNANPSGVVVSPDSTRLFLTADTLDRRGDIDMTTLAYDL